MFSYRLERETMPCPQTSTRDTSEATQALQLHGLDSQREAIIQFTPPQDSKANLRLVYSATCLKKRDEIHFAPPAGSKSEIEFTASLRHEARKRDSFHCSAARLKNTRFDSSSLRPGLESVFQSRFLARGSKAKFR